MHQLTELNRRVPQGALVMLERSAGKLARCVLRGRGGCESSLLPGDMLWIVHNFIRPHFTTGKVPAVALGIVEEGLSWEEVCTIQKIA